MELAIKKESKKVAVVAADDLSILEVIENYSDITNLGKYFAVSRTTMRKYLDMYGLLEEFKFKYEFKAKRIQQYDIRMNLINFGDGF